MSQKEVKELILLIKFAYYKACELSYLSWPFGNLSILLFDDIIEWLLTIIYKRTNFDCENVMSYGCICELAETIKQNNEQLAKNLRCRYGPCVRDIRSIRNKLKHKVKMVSDKDIEFVRKSALELLKGLIKEFFGLEWRELSLVSLVPNDTLRDDLQKTEQLINDKEYKKALQMLAEVFQKFLLDINQKFTQSKLRSPLGGPSIGSLKSKVKQVQNLDIRDICNSIIEKIEYWDSFFMGLSVSRNPRDFVRFWSLTPWAKVGLVQTEKGSEITIASSKPLYEPKEHEVWYCFNFLVDLILDWYSQQLG